MDQTTSGITVRSATAEDLRTLSILFDGYRMFYGQASDLARATAFLHERLERHDSELLLAVDAQGEGLGFVQLYPSFTSVGTARIEILNDLFVAAQARGLGVARSLLRQAASDARARGSVELLLSTALDNAPAQSLYASEGWQRDTHFVEYTKPL